MIVLAAYDLLRYQLFVHIRLNNLVVQAIEGEFQAV
jgi:hypothetical protein